MNWIYVIQDKDYSAVAGAFDEPKAIQMCKEKGSGYSYRAVPFYYTEGIEITVIAGPISEEYLRKGSLPKQQS